MPALLLALLYLALVLAPLALAKASGLAPRGVMDELASGLGMAAFAVLLVEFVLSGRFRAVSGRVGLDVTLRLHQLLARTAVLFVLLHPILYTSPIAPPRPDDPTHLFVLGLNGPALASGLIAWFAVMLIVVMAAFRGDLPFRYEVWRASHAALAVLIALGGLHHALHAGRYAATPTLAGFWVVATAGALATLAYVYLVKPLIRRARPYAVVSTRALAPAIWELVLDARGPHRLDFAAGQFVWISIGRGAFSLAENPFSIASAPAEAPRLRFVIKENGDFTRSVGAIAPGTIAHVDGPHGALTVAGRAASGLVLVAGGVGIAPILSILRDLRARRDQRPTLLILANRDLGQCIAREEIAAMRAELRLEIAEVLSDPPEGWTGRAGVLDAAMLSDILRALPDAAARLYVLCGPPAMLDAAERALLARGIPDAAILAERFDVD